MNSILLGSLLCGGAVWGYLWAGQPPAAHLASAANVNSRYFIESVEVSGFPGARLAGPLFRRLQGLVGTSYDLEILEDLAHQIRKEIHAKAVTQHIARGAGPDSVKVVFEVTRRSLALDLSVPKFLYHSKQGWSAQVEATTTVARNHNLMFGIVSDGDELTERYAGIHAGYENTHLGSDRLRLGLLVEDYHEQWNRSTVNALSPPAAVSTNFAPDLYRTRTNIQSILSYSVSRSVSVSGGLSFQRLGEVLPSTRTAGANAFVAAVRYHQVWEGSGEQTLDAAYDARFSSAWLGSDYLYSRHRGTAGWQWKRGRHTLRDAAVGGFISGRAPLFERFVLGTSSLLRGWNRFEIDPLGGNRLLHNSVDYGYRFRYLDLNAFYDTGSLWSHGKAPALRHSVGVGFHRSIFSLAVAFPVRETRVEPVFLVGMNY